MECGVVGVFTQAQVVQNLVEEEFNIDIDIARILSHLEEESNVKEKR